MIKRVILTVVALFMAVGAYCQDTWQYISKENIAFKMPENWKMINTSKPMGAMCVKIFDPNSAQFVEIRAERVKINLKVRANDIATMRSQQKNFDYMQIDKIQASKFNGHEAQELNYTNTYLNDVYCGSIYSFVKEGYTYTVEYYGENNPATQKFLKQIASTININSADKKENMPTLEQKNYTQKRWANQEIDRSAEIAAQEAAKAQAQAEKEALKAREKAEKEAAKAEAQAEKDAQKAMKAQMKADKLSAKAERKAIKKELAQQKKLAKAEIAAKKKFEKENNVQKLQSTKKSLEKELTSLASEQLKLQNEYGELQLKNEVKKMEKIQAKQTKLSDKVIKLSKERDAISSRLQDLGY